MTKNTAKFGTLITAIALACVLSLAMLVSAPARAAEVPTAGALTVRQSFNVTGTAPKDLNKTTSYTLTDESGNTVAAFSLTGDESKTIDSLTYDHAGVYAYTLTPTTKAANNRYTLDGTVYTIRAYVKNTADGLAVEYTAIAQGSDTKADEIVYHQTYKGPVPVTPTKTTTTVKKPKTGDMTNVAGWILAAAAACFVIVLTAASRKKEDQ